MAMVERGPKAKFKYRFDEFLSSGAGRQLLMLFVLSMAVVLVHLGLSELFGLSIEGDVGDRFWFYFTRILDAGTMGGDEGTGVRVISTVDTILGVIVAGLLISSLSGNFQDRLEAIKRGGSPVVEEGHFLILGWSQKIFSVIDQLSEANVDKGEIVVVVMAEGEKEQMEEELREKVTHLDRIKLVVRSGNSVSTHDLARVAFDQTAAIVVLVEDADMHDPNKADGRVIKTLMALFNHPDLGKRELRVTAEVMIAANQEIAEIAGRGKAQVIKTGEIISKILLQTSRISGLSLVYDELLRFEGNEIHYAAFPDIVGKRFSDILLDFPNGCVVGVGKTNGSSHQLNPPADYVIQSDEELLILAEDDHIPRRQHPGGIRVTLPEGSGPAAKPVEHLLVLGWNEKIYSVLREFDAYVGTGSSLTLVNAMPAEDRQKALADHVGTMKNVSLRHVVGEFTSRALMQRLQPERYGTVMVLGDVISSRDPEDADTRAIIALLLLRDACQRAQITNQEVCSEILNPKNRELAATTQIHDIVISNEMISMILAQVTHEPRVRPVLEDLFQSEGSEIYLKPISHYVGLGQPTTFEQLIVAAKARGEVALGFQAHTEDPGQRYGIVLNPKDRTRPITPKESDRLVVLAEDDG
jgi:hypothetical protein